MYEKVLLFFCRFPGFPGYLSHNSSTGMRMGIEQWWNDREGNTELIGGKRQ